MEHFEENETENECENGSESLRKIGNEVPKKLYDILTVSYNKLLIIK